MRTVAFVPVKLNNERLPGKNTKRFTGGKPLIYYILDTLQNTDALDEIYVYCSDENICDFIPSGVKYLKRSNSLDTSSTLINEVIAAFIKDVDAKNYILAHATAPFLSKNSVENAIKALNSSEYDSALTVRKFNEFLWMNRKPCNYDPAKIVRTQDLPLMYIETSGLYAFKKELFVNENRRVGHKPCFIEVDAIESCDINTMDDFLIADAIFQNIIKPKFGL